MCGRVGAGELTFESYSVGKHSAAAPAVVSAHSQLSATRLATLLHAARRWVHLLLAQVGVCCRLVASPIALVELYRTGQVWHVGGGHGSRSRHPTTRSGTNVRISQTSPTYDWTLPASHIAVVRRRPSHPTFHAFWHERDACPHVFEVVFLAPGVRLREGVCIAPSQRTVPIPSHCLFRVVAVQRP